MALSMTFSHSLLLDLVLQLLTNPFVEVKKHNIIKDFKSIPTSIDNYCIVIELGSMSHSRLRYYVRIGFMLRFLLRLTFLPIERVSVKNIGVVYYSLFAIPFTSSKDDQILSESRRTVAISI
jgi:hypothetical protein